MRRFSVIEVGVVNRDFGVETREGPFEDELGEFMVMIGVETSIYIEKIELLGD